MKQNPWDEVLRHMLVYRLFFQMVFYFEKQNLVKRLNYENTPKLCHLFQKYPIFFKSCTITLDLS